MVQKIFVQVKQAFLITFVKRKDPKQIIHEATSTFKDQTDTTTFKQFFGIPSTIRTSFYENAKCRFLRMAEMKIFTVVTLAVYWGPSCNA